MGREKGNENEWTWDVGNCGNESYGKKIAGVNPYCLIIGGLFDLKYVAH